MPYGKPCRKHTKHWVYILRCDRGDDDYGLYIGETRRLWQRLRKHCVTENGAESCGSDCCLVAIYDMDNEVEFNSPFVSELNKGMAAYFDDDFFTRPYLDAENEITKMCMRSYGDNWYMVKGGSYCRENLQTNPSLNLHDNYRPFCKCKFPADVKTWNGTSYWRCAKKNIYPALQDFCIDNEIEFDKEPCNYYHKL